MGQASRSMSGDDETKNDSADDVPGAGPIDEDDAAPEGEDPGEDAADEEEEDEEDAEEAVAAAEAIELVLLPIACTNAGKGAPLAMGVQRWLAQELAARGAKAAAPVFTAMADQNGRQVPALMVFREPWTDERALEGVGRFPNAKRGLVSDMRIDDDGIQLSSRLVEMKDGALSEVEKVDWSGKVDALPGQMLGMLKMLARHAGVEIEHDDVKSAFKSDNAQALTSFLVGLGNLSALQGRCVPTTPEQLLSPFMDAIGRDAGMDPAVQGLHLMVDILVRNPIDQSAIPLSLQALNIAAQRRKTDPAIYHHLATLFRQLGDLGSAVQAFNQAFNIDPTSAAVTDAFIQTLRGAGDNANALKVAQFAAEKGNEDPRLFAHLGSLMIENDQFDEAEPFLRRAIDDGKVASAYGDLANVLWDRGDSDDGQPSEDRQEAMELLRTAVEDGRLAKSALDMLLDLHEDEKSEQATLLLLKAAEKFPKSATVLRYVATMYLDGDDPPKAREYLERMLALPRRTLDDDAFARRGRLQLDVEDFDEKYDEAIEQVRGGDVAGKTAAAKFLRQIIAKDERFWQPHLMLALAVRETDGDSAALGHLNAAVKLRPNDAEIRNLIAAIHRKQGRPREAIEHLRAVVALNPRDVEPVVHLASAMRDANMFAEARQVCTAALQMIPNHPEFKKILESLPPPSKEELEAEADDGDDDEE
jgi:tetratricopeptide (TPR) repeat protein